MKYFSGMSQRTAGALIGIMFLAQVAAPTAGAAISGRKYHPGQYIALKRTDGASAFLSAVRPGVVGMQKRYRWAILEPTKGHYDFSAIQADLNLAATQGMQLVVFVEDKSFNRGMPTPGYLSSYTFANRQHGYTVKRWDPYVVGRFQALLTALGNRFDSHPNFEGVAIQETALSLENDVLDANGYTPQKYRDALIAELTTAAKAMPHSQVFWYMNFLTRKQSYIGDIATAVAKLGVSMGGPDVLPDSSSLVQRTYPFYDKFEGKMTLFSSMQNSSYHHRHQQASSTKYWTLNELDNYARDQLHVSYLFWNRKTQIRPSDSYWWMDALPVIEYHPKLQP